MQEKHKAGIKGFINAVLLSLAILLGYDFIDTAFRMSGIDFAGREIILTVHAVALCSVLVYFVITRYAALYTYEMKQKSVVITRKIGYRERIEEIRNTELCSLTSKRPLREVKKVYRMQKTILSGSVYYVLYKRGREYYIMQISCSKEFARAIEERIKG